MNEKNRTAKYLLLILAFLMFIMSIVMALTIQIISGLMYNGFGWLFFYLSVKTNKRRKR